MKTNSAENTAHSIEEAERITGLSAAQLNKARKAGQLPALIYGPKCVKYRLADLLAYRDSFLTGGNGKPAKGSVHPNLAASRANRPKKSAPQPHPAPLPKSAGETPNA